jgi:hypothetical protein
LSEALRRAFVSILLPSDAVSAVILTNFFLVMSRPTSRGLDNTIQF